MTAQIECKWCNKDMDHNVKHVMYYLNGMPIYQQLCKACLKECYEKLYEEMQK